MIGQSPISKRLTERMGKFGSPRENYVETRILIFLMTTYLYVIQFPS